MNKDALKNRALPALKVKQLQAPVFTSQPLPHRMAGSVKCRDEAVIHYPPGKGSDEVMWRIGKAKPCTNPQD
jgi:hypothetical protein